MYDENATCSALASPAIGHWRTCPQLPTNC